MVFSKSNLYKDRYDRQGEVDRPTKSVKDQVNVGLAAAAAASAVGREVFFLNTYYLLYVRPLMVLHDVPDFFPSEGEFESRDCSVLNGAQGARTAVHVAKSCKHTGGD